MKSEEEVKKMLERVSSIRKHPFWWGGKDNTIINAIEKILGWVLGKVVEDEIPFMDTIKEMENGTFQPADL